MATFAAFSILALLMQAAIAVVMQRWLRDIAVLVVAMSATAFGGIVAFLAAVAIANSTALPLFVCVLYPLPAYFVAAITGAIVQMRLSKVPPPGCCRNCGYDLTGNLSGRCPECGRTTGADSDSH